MRGRRVEVWSEVRFDTHQESRKGVTETREGGTTLSLREVEGTGEGDRLQKVLNPLQEGGSSSKWS